MLEIKGRVGGLAGRLHEMPGSGATVTQRNCFVEKEKTRYIKISSVENFLVKPRGDFVIDTPEPGEIETLMLAQPAVADRLRAVAVPVTRDLDRREADTLLRSYLEPHCFPDAVRRL